MSFLHNNNSEGVWSEGLFCLYDCASRLVSGLLSWFLLSNRGESNSGYCLRMYYKAIDKDITAAQTINLSLLIKLCNTHV